MNRNVIQLTDYSGVPICYLTSTEAEMTTSRELNSAWTCQVRYPIPLDRSDAEDKSSYFRTYKNGIRVRNNATGKFDTFIFTKTTLEQNTSGQTVIVAEGSHLVLSKMNDLIVSADFDFVNMTPTQILTKLIAYLPGWSVGTVQPTSSVQVQTSWEPLSLAIQKLLVACQGELVIDEFNSTLGINSSSTVTGTLVYVQPGKNLSSIRNTFYSENIKNKIFGVGGGSPSITIAGARHIVSNISGATITVEGNKVVPEDDSWNGYKIKFVTGAKTGLLFTISDCVHSTNDTIITSTSSGAAIGDKFVICDATDNEISFIRAGTSIATYGSYEGVYKDTNYSDANNLVNTPALDGTYSSGLCAGWSKNSSPTLTENTDPSRIQYGAKSQRIQGAGNDHGVYQQVAITSGRYYRTTVWVYIASGTVKLEVTDGTSTWAVVKSETGWQKFTIAEKMNGSTMTIRIYQSGSGTSVSYLDAAMVTEGILEYSFTYNSDLKSLWDLTFNSLMSMKDPEIEYEAEFVDLFNFDSSDYPYDEISIGDTVLIIDPQLNITRVSARIRRIERNEFDPRLTKHTISNRQGVWFI